jgi:type I restriction enzyme S subunit
MAVDQQNIKQGKRSLPDGWQLVKLEKVCRVISGSTPDTNVPEYWGGEIVWITPTDLGLLNGNRIVTSARRITKTGYDSCGTEIVDPGAVILSTRAPIGHLGIASVPLCTNQGCKSFVPSENVDSEFLYYSLKQSVPILQKMGSGATFSEISKRQVQNFEILLPPLSQQKRIVAILNEQMWAVEKARDAKAAQLEVAKLLPTAYLRTIFNSTEAQKWPRRRISEVCHLLPSKSISTNGDAEVLAITTACLSETGFQDSGLKHARMNAKDSAECRVSPGEVLVARSNTPELVGRVAMFEGEPKEAVASDLTIRLSPSDAVKPFFLTAYLSFLYLRGHWKERAGGASGSMKKITRRQIQEERVPIPLLLEQRRIETILKEQITGTQRILKALKDQFNNIKKLPAVLLQRAFSGEL